MKIFPTWRMAMEVKIKANTINQIVNADVISSQDIAALSSADRDQLFDKLVDSIKKRSEVLGEAPVEVSGEQIKALVDKVNDLVNQIASHKEDVSTNKSNIVKIFETFKTYFGGSTDILLNVVKLAQAVGLFSGGH